MAKSAPLPTTAPGPRSTRPGFPAAPAAPTPPQTRPRRRWQRHLHIWRPCSRFRDGARAALMSPRTMRTWRRRAQGRFACVEARQEGGGFSPFACASQHKASQAVTLSPTSLPKPELSRLGIKFTGFRNPCSAVADFFLVHYHPGSHVAFNYISIASSTL